MNTKSAFQSAPRKIGTVILVALIFTTALPWHAYADTCPAGGDHAYQVDIVRFATESEDGLRLFTCVACGYNFEQVIPATGHRWSEWITDVESTCTSPGRSYRVCENFAGSPHYEEQILPALSTTGTHSYTVTEEVAPTCEAGGYRIMSCSVCGEGYQEELDPLGHVWGPWEVEIDPTSTKEGRERRVCLHDANHVEDQAIPALKNEPSGRPTQQIPAALEKPEKPQIPDPFFSGPNTFDAVVLALDLTVLIVFLLAALPLIHQMKWIKLKRLEARKVFLDQMRDTKEAPGRRVGL